MTKTSTPKIIFTCKFRYALNNPDNPYRKDKDYKKFLESDIDSMTDYYKDPKKEIIDMIDYYAGSKQEQSVNLVLENGNHATYEEQEKLKEQFINAIENSNLYKGVASFDTEWITQTIKIRDLEKLIAKEVMPKFLKKCGFKDIKKMRYFFSMHGNTSHLHLHMAFVELKANHVNRDGKILYRRLGMITEEEKNFFKNELLIAIERNSVFKPLLIETNKDIDNLKTYFKPGDKNFILKDINEIRIEEKIIKLGWLINEYREDNTYRKVKYGSIKNNNIGKQIKTLTKEIKRDIFNNQNSDLYNKRGKVEKDLKKLNEYYNEVNNKNHIEKKIKENKLIITKQNYIDSYINNAIINHALFRTNMMQNIVKTKNTNSKITLDDLLQELAYKISEPYKNKNIKLIILNNYLKNSIYSKKFRFCYEVTKAINDLNYETEKYSNEFHKLFDNQEYSYKE